MFQLSNYIYTVQRQKLHFLLNGILYVAYEQEIYSLLTLRFHKFEKNAVCEVVKYKWTSIKQKKLKFIRVNFSKRKT
ncbi:hypothetical protein MSIBF_A2480009 [groundwater metagenome]|uniref:Uncharacterized protein n=1 Tax=groundwater metagenome TaxID=717931 RepID=A0A098E983_9ZZZZ